MWTWALTAFSCALILNTATPYESDAQGGAIELSAGQLTQSLEALSRQLGIQILFDAEALKGIKAPGISGYLSARDALDKLLKGTSLIVHRDGDAFLITTDTSPASTTEESEPSRESASKNIQLEEINVTGTHIHGESPVGASLSTYDRDDFDKLGTATADSLARYMLENFSGADSLATLNTNGNVGSVQQGAASNIFGGSGFDLLGLGAGATLTLLDGHRIATGGLDGSMVDVSLIPLSIVDHIEVLTDGASAIYGSDAVAGVVNIVTRRTMDGAETSLRYGQSTERGAGEFTGSQLLGYSWSTGNVLLDYEYDDQQGLDASERSWIGSEDGPYSLIPENHRQSLFLAGTQNLNDTEFSVVGLYSSREFRTNGLQLSTSGVVPNSDIGGGHANLAYAAITVDRDLSAMWHVSSTATYSGMNQWRSGEEYPDGLAGPDFNDALLADSEVAGLDLSGSGQVLHLPAGALQLALGGGFRSENYRDSVLSIEPLPAVSQARTDLDGYGEVIVPIFGRALSFPGARRLEMSFAYRLDGYSHLGTAANPKWGWTWEPIGGLTVRGTQGTSFKAPLISQLDATLTSYTTFLPSSAPGGKPSDALVVNGGNQDREVEVIHFRNRVGADRLATNSGVDHLLQH
jgi:iron complex outermembrane recepter protein